MLQPNGHLHLGSFIKINCMLVYSNKYEKRQKNYFKTLSPLKDLLILSTRKRILCPVMYFFAFAPLLIHSTIHYLITFLRWQPMVSLVTSILVSDCTRCQKKKKKGQQDNGKINHESTVTEHGFEVWQCCKHAQNMSHLAFSLNDQHTIQNC